MAPAHLLLAVAEAAAGLVLAGLLLNTFGERLFARRVAAE